MASRHTIGLIFALGLIASACASSSGEVSDIVSDVPASTVTSETGSETTTSNQPIPEEGFIVQDGDLVEVHYIGTLDDGSEFDSSRSRDVPFSFTVGTGQVISGFDEGVRGGKVGDVRTVRMEAVDAYGEWSEENIIEVPFNPDQGDVEVGDEVFLNNGQAVVVLEVTSETVKLDANHQLAGEALTFEIEILAITRP